jgi:hypothetical protein
MQRASWLATAMLSAWCGGAAAQTAPATPAVPAPVAAAAPEQAAPAPTGLRLPAGTLVAIALGEQLTSKDRTRGDKFAIQLAAPITLDGRVVAPAGATGQGEVVYAEAAKGGGAPGKLVLAARYIDVGQVRVPLKAFQLASSGENEFTKMYVASQLIGPAVMFMNGQEVVYPAGVRASAKIAQDVVFPPPPDAPPPAAAPPSAAVTSAAVTPAALTPAATPAQPTAPVQEPVK